MPSQSTYINHTIESSSIPVSRPHTSPYLYQPSRSPVAPSPHAMPPQSYPTYYPSMNSPYMQNNPYGYYYPPQQGYGVKRESSSMVMPAKPMKKVKRNLTDEQRAGKTLLSKWKDLRRAGIEVRFYDMIECRLRKIELNKEVYCLQV